MYLAYVSYKVLSEDIESLISVGETFSVTCTKLDSYEELLSLLEQISYGVHGCYAVVEPCYVFEGTSTCEIKYVLGYLYAEDLVRLYLKNYVISSEKLKTLFRLGIENNNIKLSDTVLNYLAFYNNSEDIIYFSDILELYNDNYNYDKSALKYLSKVINSIGFSEDLLNVFRNKVFTIVRGLILNSGSYDCVVSLLLSFDLLEEQYNKLENACKIIKNQVLLNIVQNVKKCNMKIQEQLEGIK